MAAPGADMTRPECDMSAGSARRGERITNEHRCRPRHRPTPRAVVRGRPGDPPADAAPGARTLLVRLGADEAHIGPLLLDQVTECPACVARIHPHPAGEPNVLRKALWTGLAAQYAFLAVTQLAPGSSLRGFRVQRLDGGELSQRTALAVRLPGCPRCGIGKEAWPPDDPRLLAWIFHNATSLQNLSLIHISEPTRPY